MESWKKKNQGSNETEQNKSDASQASLNRILTSQSQGRENENDSSTDDDFSSQVHQRQRELDTLFEKGELQGANVRQAKKQKTTKNPNSKKYEPI